MALFKKGDIWYVDYYIDGRRKREAVGTNRKMAERVLAKRKVQIAENRYLDVVRRPKVTFEQLSSQYLEYAKVNKLSWSRDALSIQHLTKHFADKTLTDVSARLIEKYKNERRKVVGPATVNRELACLKHMFTKAIHWRLADSNPVKLVKLLRENNRRLRYLTEEELRRLYHECADHLKAFILMAVYTGMRRGEILKLKWDDVSIDQQVIYVRNTKNGSTREIPIALPILQMLKA